MADETTALAARLGSYARTAVSRTLTIDNTTRSKVLVGGGYRLYGSATQVYYAIRHATDAAGTLMGSEAAPSSLGASVAGAAAGSLDSTATDGGVPLPTSTSDWVEIAVPTGGFHVLYARAASSTTAVLVGPFQ